VGAEKTLDAAGPDAREPEAHGSDREVHPGELGGRKAGQEEGVAGRFQERVARQDAEEGEEGEGHALAFLRPNLRQAAEHSGPIGPRREPSAARPCGRCRSPA
jgi:hypothetical protein